MVDIAAPQKDKKVFDIAKPGKSAPSETSRPLIVGRKLIVQDGDISAPAATEFVENKTEEPEVMHVSEKNVEPLTSPEAESQEESEKLEEPVKLNDNAAAESAPATQDEAEQKPASEEQPPAKAETTHSSEVSADTPEKTEDSIPVSSESAELNAIADQANKKKSEKDILAEETSHEEAIQKLVASKEYVITVKAPKDQRSIRLMLITILILVVLTVIGGDLAIDAGLIKTNVKPLTNLIKN